MYVCVCVCVRVCVCKYIFIYLFKYMYLFISIYLIINIFICANDCLFKIFVYEYSVNECNCSLKQHYSHNSCYANNNVNFCVVDIYKVT